MSNTSGVAMNRIIPVEPDDAERCTAPLPASATANPAKHPTEQPTRWTNSEGDANILLRTQPGLKFDQTRLIVKAGAKVRFIFVPDSPDVLFHTALVQPETSDTIYFTAPTAPGDYDYICSSPGHSVLMKGILRVTAK